MVINPRDLLIRKAASSDLSSLAARKLLLISSSCKAPYLCSFRL